MEVTIADDGPGFPIELMETLGEPYVTTRPAPGATVATDTHPASGLGFFIAKHALLERSGATIALENRPPPAKGALVRIFWPRPLFERKGIGAAAEFTGAGL